METEAELRERCAYWQRLLRLQDWRIRTRFTDSSPSGGTDGHLGTVRVWPKSKAALIRIQRDPATEFAQAFPADADPEITLVHELLEIHLYGLLNDKPSRHEGALQEQAIDLVAGALVRLDREAGAK